KQARVVNPWGTQQVRVRRTSDNAVITTSTASEISFATAANTNYVVERTAKLLSSYSATTLTGTQNNGVKSLSGTASTLGIGGRPPPGPRPDVLRRHQLRRPSGHARRRQLRPRAAAGGRDRQRQRLLHPGAVRLHRHGVPGQRLRRDTVDVH